MPPLPDAPFTLKCIFKGTYGSTKWANVMHMKYGAASSLTPTNCNTIAQAFHGYYVSRFLPRVSSSVNLLETDITDLNSSTGAQGAYVHTDPGTFSNASNMSANNALCISWKTSFRFRGGHARTYLVGMPSAQLADTANFNTTFTGATQTAANNFLADINAYASGGLSNCTLSMLSYYSGGSLRALGLAFPITSALVNTRVDSQRRRNGK